MIAESSATPQTTPDFDSLAHIYRWMEWTTFGPFLGLCRRAFLSQMRPQSRALISELWELDAASNLPEIRLIH